MTALPLESTGSAGSDTSHQSNLSAKAGSNSAERSAGTKPFLCKDMGLRVADALRNATDELVTDVRH